MKETRIVATMIATIVIYVAYLIIVIGMEQDGRFDGEDAVKLIGQSILILIGAQIVGNIIAQILASIVHAVITREAEKELMDERDRLIEMRALRTSFVVFGIGFVAVVAAMAFASVTVFLAFQLVMGALTVADLIGNATRLRLRRRGF